MYSNSLITLNKESPLLERVLIIVERETQFELASELCISLASLGCKLNICSSSSGNSWVNTLKQKTNEWDANFINSAEFEPSETYKLLLKPFFFLVKLIDKFFGKHSNFNFGSFIALTTEISREKNRWKALLDLNQPDYILVFEDGIGGPLEFIAMAKQKNIPLAICPYEISQRKDLENVISRNRANNTEYFPPEGLIGKYFNQCAADWIFQDTKGKSLLLPAEIILARKLLNVGPLNPWVIHGGRANLIAVESQRCFDIYVDDGIPVSKLKILGSTYGDKLFRLGRRRTKQLSRKKTVLVSLPPNYDDFYNNNSLGSYLEMLNTLASSLKNQPDLRALVSVHPSTLGRDRENIMEFDWEISHKPILEDLNQSDLCISFFSSTIRWFLASNIPVINLDVWGFQLELYNKSIGFFNCGNETDFKKNLSSLLIHSNFELIKKNMSREASSWGVIDGEATSRLLSTLRTMKTN